MKVFALALIASSMVQVYSQINSTQQESLTYPTGLEESRQTAGVPGRRESKGDL